MKYNTTNLFSECMKSEDPEVRKSAIIDRENMFNEYEEIGVMAKDIEELDYFKIEDNRILYLDRVGREFALSKDRKIKRISCNSDEDSEMVIYKIEEIFIEEFTGNFEELFTLVDDFPSVKTIKVNSMVSVNEAKIDKSHKDNCVIEIGKCSIISLDESILSSELNYPKVKIEESLLDEIGIFGKFVVKTGIEEWTEKVTDANSTRFNTQIELTVGKRFNGVTIFNKLYATKLRSLGKLDYNVELSPCNKEHNLEDMVEKTNWGYKLIRKSILFDILFSISNGEFESDKLEVEFIPVEVNDNE